MISVLGLKNASPALVQSGNSTDQLLVFHTVQKSILIRYTDEEGDVGSRLRNRPREMFNCIKTPIVAMTAMKCVEVIGIKLNLARHYRPRPSVLNQRFTFIRKTDAPLAPEM